MEAGHLGEDSEVGQQWLKVVMLWTSLVVQWFRIHLPIQGTQVRSLVQEDSICHGATKPMCHNY